MVGRVPLRGRAAGTFAVVDKDLEESLCRRKWSLSWDGYPRTSIYLSRESIRMSRLIMQPPDDVLVDHINGDRLDNRRANLRYATIGQNNANSKPRGWHGFKGIVEDRTRTRKRWRAQIHVNRKTVEIGAFENIEDAARAYDKRALELHGGFAWLNFPDDK